MIKFSFIIPIYNGENYIEMCVQNLIAIDRTDIEIILIDDGSIDGSGRIIDELAGKYEQIIAVHQQNQGVSAARNHGLEIAKGEYVLFLDADDTIEPDKLNALLSVLDRNPSIDMAIFGLSFDYYRHGNLYRTDALVPPFSGEVERKNWLGSISELYDVNALSPIWNKVIKRDVLIKNALALREDMFLYEDLEFSLRCMAHCEKIYFSQDCIYHYRQSEDEGNAGRRLKRIAHIPDLLEKIDVPLRELLSGCDAADQADVGKSILLKLYLVLAREKCEVSKPRDIRIVCRDFRDWAQKEHITLENRQFAEELCQQKVFAIICRREYTRIRHRIAVVLKSTQWYQRKIEGK